MRHDARHRQHADGSGENERANAESGSSSVTGYTREERRALASAVSAGDTPHCPRCGTLLEARPVDPGPAVAYVRHRVLLICPGCHRTTSIDV